MVIDNIDVTELLSKTCDIKAHMKDDLSRRLYDIRLQYFYDRNEDNFCDSILRINDFRWKIPRLKRMMENNPESKNVIIFGAGKYGKRTYKILKNSELGGAESYSVIIIRVY